VSGGVAAGYPAMLDELQKLGFKENRDLTVEYRSVEQRDGWRLERIENVLTV
jgi:hypothetical protein